jgi:hypothetical protein
LPNGYELAVVREVHEDTADAASTTTTGQSYPLLTDAIFGALAVAVLDTWEQIQAHFENGE